MRLVVAIVLSCAVLTWTGCYRMAPPETTNANVRIEFSKNEAALVRTQAELQRALGDALSLRLGWKVAPNGANRLLISLKQEKVASTASDRDGIPARWRITINGAMVFEADGNSKTGMYTGIGNASGLDGETEAIRSAAADAAAMISAWLELSR